MFWYGWPVNWKCESPWIALNHRHYFALFDSNQLDSLPLARLNLLLVIHRHWPNKHKGWTQPIQTTVF